MNSYISHSTLHYYSICKNTFFFIRNRKKIFFDLFFFTKNSFFYDFSSKNNEYYSYSNNYNSTTISERKNIFILSKEKKVLLNISNRFSMTLFFAKFAMFFYDPSYLTDKNQFSLSFIAKKKWTKRYY